MVSQSYVNSTLPRVVVINGLLLVPLITRALAIVADAAVLFVTLRETVHTYKLSLGVYFRARIVSILVKNGT